MDGNLQIIRLATLIKFLTIIIIEVVEEVHHRVHLIKTGVTQKAMKETILLPKVIANLKTC